jgi:hypothetical protein
MPVLEKDELRDIKSQLNVRYSTLQTLLDGRDLRSVMEGCPGSSHWVYPERKSATIGNSTEIRIAVSDFQTILKEILRLK